MSESVLYHRMKAIAIRLEEHRWHNSRGEHFQAAIIMKPEQRTILTDFLRDFGGELSTTERSVIPVETNKQPRTVYIHGHEVFVNVSLRNKRSYRSYMANLDEPNPEIIKLLRKRLELCRMGELPYTNTALLELTLKEEMQRPFRDYILERLTKNGDLKAAHLFTAKLSTAERCLITNFATAPEVLWASLRRIGRKTQDLRLPEGVSVFFSHQDRTKPLGKVGPIVEKAKENGWLYGDWVLI